MLVQEAGRLAIPFAADGQSATLYVTPGATGPNHYRLELGSGHEAHLASPADATEALLRIEAPSYDTGQKQITLARAAGNAYEGHGSELSIAGDWTIEVIVRQAGQPDWKATATRSIATTPSTANLPGPPWRFGPAGVAGLLLLVGGLAGLVVAWQVGRSPLRKETAGLGAAALAVGAVLLLQARIGPGGAGSATSALAAFPPPDPAAVVRGEAIYTANCLTCHGPRGKGDGPAAAGLSRPPADFTIPHSFAHRDADFCLLDRQRDP